MDAGLSLLTKCEKLSLSTNAIDKISNLHALKNLEHLKILSLARNNIKIISGLEPLGETLEELWISYNLIEKLKGLSALKKLRVLYISNNKVKDWVELLRLNDLPSLADLVFVGNPLEENNPDTFRDEAMRKLPKIKKLDGIPFVRDDED
ncbi:Dynein light chain 1, axonemal [Hymenolepis weldensis]